MPAGHSARSVTLSELARAVGGQVTGAADTAISGVSSLEQAQPGDLAYVDGDRFVKAALDSKAAAFVVAQPLADLPRPQLVAANPKYAFALLVQQFFTPAYKARGVAQQISQGTGVQIGPDVSIWPFVTLGDRVRIGAVSRSIPACSSETTPWWAMTASSTRTSRSGSAARLEHA